MSQTLEFTPFCPVPDQASLFAPAFVGVSAYEYTNWRDETISWKTTAYLHAGLNPTDTYRLKGSDVIKFLSRVCATNFDIFPVGRIKHGLVVDEKGRIVQDGVLVRTAEDEVMTYWMVPMLNYYLDTKKFGDFDVTGEIMTGKVFLFQIGGPVSIDIVERASGMDLRDLKFLRSVEGTIAGKPVRILRIGMAGTIAYEVHGAIEDAHEVYNALYEAGKPLGIRRLGSHCYPMNHAENGFPQYGVHFMEPKSENEDLMNYLKTTPGMEFHVFTATAMNPQGSAADEPSLFYHNPFEFGWGKMIHFDHEFVGKEALEKIKTENKRGMVTLEWNVDDVAEVYASQFKDEEPYKYIDTPTDLNFWPDMTGAVFHDRVLNEKGENIGVSFGRQNSAYFHRMISICCLDTKYAELGTEVYVLWGDPGKRQKKIRAKITRFPYNNVLRNESTDVSKLPKAEEKQS